MKTQGQAKRWRLWGLLVILLCPIIVSVGWGGAVRRAALDTVLLDPANSVGGRYNGGELPTNILIDSDGKVRRRFIGARPLAAWESMLAEIHGRR